MTTHAQSLAGLREDAGATRASASAEEATSHLIVGPFFHTFGYRSGILASLIEGAAMISRRPSSAWALTCTLLDPVPRRSPCCRARRPSTILDSGPGSWQSTTWPGLLRLAADAGFASVPIFVRSA
ncbi:hypothetical protein ACU686_30915 [Yinghuangia aomiensis]